MPDKETGLPLEAPELNIPSSLAYMWANYMRLSEQVSRIDNGVCGRIPPSEYYAWCILTKTSLDELEYDLMVDMDAQFCIAMNQMLEELRLEAKAEADRNG